MFKLILSNISLLKSAKHKRMVDTKQRKGERNVLFDRIQYEWILWDRKGGEKHLLMYNVFQRDVFPSKDNIVHVHNLDNLPIHSKFFCQKCVHINKHRCKYNICLPFTFGAYINKSEQN